MALDPEMLKKLLEVFKLELAEQLQLITEGLIDLEKNPEDQSILNTIFRAAHTIKGSGRSVGLESIGEIAHALENVFSEMREGRLMLTPTINDACLAAVDAMQAAMQQYEKNPDEKFPTESILSQLTTVLTQKKTETTEEKPVPPSVVSSAVEIETPEYLSVSVEKVNVITTLADSILSNSFFLETYQKQLALLRKTLRELIKKNSELSMHPSIKVLYQILDAMEHETRSRGNELALLTRQLQENLQEIRLVPSAIILRPLSRLVRDIAKELGKKVNLKTQGEEIEIDRAIVEYLKAPLMHLIRNAIDHGIETPNERKDKGKPEAGNIDVSVSHISGNVRIIISDDGRGIDPDEIGRIAVEKSFVTKADLARLTPEEIYRFLFQPGFSTAKAITEISGRGVGLDVVQNNIHRAKGKIKMESLINQGARIIIDVPLSLSADRGTWIRLGEHRFIIPTFSIVRLMKANDSEIRTIDNEQIILFQDQPILLRDLASLLKIKKTKSININQQFIVVIEKNQKQVAFLVDEIMGEEEIIVKSLLPPLSLLENVMGASLTSRGQIVMILNPSDLVQVAGEEGSLSKDEAMQVRPQKIPRILVVDDSITTRTMEVGILQSEGYEVESAANGQEALRRLRAKKFDLVVSDIDMPIMTGFELSKNIKSDPMLQHIKVIIVSSHQREEDRKKGVEANADAYIVKSQYEGKALLDVVKELMKRAV